MRYQVIFTQIVTALVLCSCLLACPASNSSDSVTLSACAELVGKSDRDYSGINVELLIKSTNERVALQETGADGCFAFDGVATGQDYQLLLTRTSYEAKTAEVKWEGAQFIINGGNLPIRLEPTDTTTSNNTVSNRTSNSTSNQPSNQTTGPGRWGAAKWGQGTFGP